MKSIIYSLVGLILAVCFTACKDKTNRLVVGVMSGPELELANIAKDVAKKTFDLDVEIRTFDDYIVPNEALSSRDIDLNVFQHLPFLEEQVKKRGYKLSIVGNTFIYPIAAFSNKLKKGAVLDDDFVEMTKKFNIVTIPNDPTNEGRALLLLEKSGIIKLKDGVGLFPKPIDIAENKYNLDFKELDAPMIPKSISEDKVLFVVSNNTYISKIGLNAIDDGIFVEDKDSPYVNIIVSREDNKEDPKIKKFVQAYQSAEVEAKALEIFKNSAIKGW